MTGLGCSILGRLTWFNKPCDAIGTGDGEDGSSGRFGVSTLEGGGGRSVDDGGVSAGNVSGVASLEDGGVPPTV